MQNGVEQCARSERAGLKFPWGVVCCLVVVPWLGACEIKDEDRCSEGEYFEGYACWPIEPDSGTPDTEEPEDTDTNTDALPEGMNQPCTGPGSEDCAGYVADFCLGDPFNDYVGICTIKDCTTAPDNCPSDWRCCKFLEMAQMPNACLTAEDYQAQSEAGYCIE